MTGSQCKRRKWNRTLPETKLNLSNSSSFLIFQTVVNSIGTVATTSQFCHSNTTCVPSNTNDVVIVCCQTDLCNSLGTTHVPRMPVTCYNDATGRSSSVQFGCDYCMVRTEKYISVPWTKHTEVQLNLNYVSQRFQIWELQLLYSE